MRRVLRIFFAAVLCFVLMMAAVGCTCIATAATKTAATMDELSEYLKGTFSGKENTILLEDDMIPFLEKSVILKSKSLVIDGQGHALRPSMNNTDTLHIEISAPSKGTLKLRNICDLGNMRSGFLSGSLPRVELENVKLTGNDYAFFQVQGFLSSVQLSEETARDSRSPTVTIQNKGKLILDEKCSVGNGWRLYISNSEAVVDCDYYDVWLESFAKGSVSFTGKGVGKGTLSVNMTESGVKASVDTRVQNLRLSFQSKSKKAQTISAKGSANAVVILFHDYPEKNQKVNLNLTGVEKLTLYVELQQDRADPPEDNEALHERYRKAFSGISFRSEIIGHL